MDDMRDRFRGYQPSRPVSRPVAAPSRPSAPEIPKPPTVKPSNPSYKPAKTKKRKGKKVFMTLLVLLLLGGLAGGGYWYMKKGGAKTDNNNPYAITPGAAREPDSAIASAKGSVRLIATGDMIAHDSINQNAKNGESYDYLKLMDKMKPFFDKADVRFCNQATPAGGTQFGISGYPVFNAPVEFARGIEAVGCNVINIGTNHTNDKGQPLIDATVAAWDDRKVLAVAGANRSAEEQKKVRYFESKGLKFAFLSYTTYTNNKSLTPHGLNMYSESLVTEQITEARGKSDVVIVSMRWGTEYSPGVNAEQDRIAAQLASLGADVVFGHGPHVLEPVKKLPGKDGRETLVWFSLGNFLNSQLDMESLVNGIAIMDIDIPTKKVSKVSFMPIYQHYEWTAEQKKRGNGADLAARHDFTLVPLDTAEALLAKSQNSTTIAAQTERIKKVLNTFTEVSIVASSEY